MSGPYIIAITVILAMIALALSFKPMRKTIGLLLIILGGLACMTFIGVVIGIPMIIIGGLMMFV
ncbi:hypothetical protein IT398_02050 [Candidatus Nomurabacteria bacterium]|nr:hypothetical protein [Candidatus Nomurabacteria bacterium]